HFLGVVGAVDLQRNELRGDGIPHPWIGICAVVELLTRVAPLRVEVEKHRTVQRLGLRERLRLIVHPRDLSVLGDEGWSLGSMVLGLGGPRDTADEDGCQEETCSHEDSCPDVNPNNGVLASRPFDY